jgi:Transposase IS200 like
MVDQSSYNNQNTCCQNQILIVPAMPNICLIIILCGYLSALLRVMVGDIAIRIKDIFFTLATENGWDILALEVAPDHIHLFVSVNPTDAPHLVVKAFKGRSSYYLRMFTQSFKNYPVFGHAVILLALRGTSVMKLSRNILMTLTTEVIKPKLI